MKALFLLLIAVVSVTPQTRTVTNSDLEKFRQERLRAEEDYRRNYQRLGLPSPEEIEKIKDQRRREFEAYAGELRERREAAESGIIERANTVRSQIASIDAQLRYLRSVRGSTFNQPATYWSFGFSRNYYPRPGFGRREPVREQLPTNLQTVTDISRMYPNSTDVYNRSVGNYAFENQRPRGGYFGNGYLYPVLVTVGSGSEADSQIAYLEQVRAGLMAEWRIVEEEARSAGIRID